MEEAEIKPFDFKKPIRFVQELQMIQDAFSSLSASFLSAQLRSLVRIRRASLTQTVSSNFIESVQNPSVLTAFSLYPLKGSAILEISPSIAFTLIGRLFGGSAENIKIQRELTELELSVINAIIIKLLKNLEESFSVFADLKLEIEKIETNPNLVQVIPPNDEVLVISFQITVSDAECPLNICIPYKIIESVLFSIPREETDNSSLHQEQDEISKAASDILQKSVIRQHTEYKISIPGVKISEISLWKKGQRLEISEVSKSKKMFETVPQEISQEK